MSLHRSLKTNKFKKKRNVKKRHERILKIMRTERWFKGDSCYGLPKEKIKRFKFQKKDDKKEKEQELTPVEKLVKLENENNVS